MIINEEKKNSPEKVYLDKVMIQKSSNDAFTWKEIKDFQFEDDDLVKIEYVEPFYSENNSYDGHYIFEVIREVLETDEQYEKRIMQNELDREKYRKERYERYLKMKQEFEPDDFTLISDLISEENSKNNETAQLGIGAIMHRLKEVQTLKNNPDLLLLMAEFKRANFVGSYIMEHRLKQKKS